MHTSHHAGLPGDEASAAIGRGPAAVSCDLSWRAHLPSEEPCGTRTSISMAVAGAATAGREGVRGSAAAEPRLAFEIPNGAPSEDGRLGVGWPWPDLAFLLLRVAFDDDRQWLHQQSLARLPLPIIRLDLLLVLAIQLEGRRNQASEPRVWRHRS